MNIGKKIAFIMLLAAVFSFLGNSVFAAAPSGGYGPGDTLDPDCAPSDVDCIVVIPTTFLELTDTINAYTEGALLFSSDSEVVDDPTNLFYDLTNSYLGIGTDAPEYSLDVSGSSRVVSSIAKTLRLSGGHILSGAAGHRDFLKLSSGIILGGGLSLDSTGNIQANSIRSGLLSIVQSGNVPFAYDAFNTTSATNVIDLVSGDFNGDGNPDFALFYSTSANIGLYYGNGDGTFETQVLHNSGVARAYRAVAEDVNGDGWTDLVKTNNTLNSVSVITNDGDGTFTNASTLATAGSVVDVVVDDVNADGLKDVIASDGSTSGGIYVFLANTDGTFQSAVSYNGLNGSFGVASGDVNGDGWVDIVASGFTSDNFGVYINNGDGTFAAVDIYSAGDAAFEIILVDIDNDFDLDIVLENYNDQNIQTYTNDGTGSFSLAETFAVGVVPYTLRSGDINGDGWQDIVLGAGNVNFSIFFNDQDGTFTERSDDGYPVLDLVDFDNNGTLDIIAATQLVSRVYFFPNEATPVLFADTVSGNVGVGTNSPANDKLHVVGDIRVGTSGNNGCLKDFSGTGIAGTCSSDVNLKKDFRPLENVLDKVKLLAPTFYKWRKDEFPEFGFGDQEVLGLVAQDVEVAIPELVEENGQGGYKAIRYFELQFYILEALKELNEKFDLGIPLAGDQETALSQISTFLATQSSKVINGISHFFGLTAKKIEVQDITISNTICIGETCITETELKALLEKNEIDSAQMIPSFDDEIHTEDLPQEAPVLENESEEILEPEEIVEETPEQEADITTEEQISEEVVEEPEIPQEENIEVTEPEQVVEETPTGDTDTNPEEENAEIPENL